MPIHYSRTKFSGRLNLNSDVRPSLRWISPDVVFGITGFGAVNVPLVVEVRNLPSATFEVISGELPQGISIVGSAIVGDTLGVASGVYNITIRAQSRHLFADREFQLVVIGGDYEFHWITPAGLIDGSNEGEPTAAVVEAHDPYALPITYRRIGGPIPAGTTLNANGVFTGDYGFVSNDTDYTFTVEADNGVQKIEREFTISVWDTPPGDAPQWETPKGDLGKFYEGMDISLFLEAISPNGNPIIYEIKGGSPPLGTQLMANGVVQGLLDEVEDDTVFRITVGASNDGGEHFSKRLFEITVLQNYEPEWITPEGLILSEVEGYEVDLTLLATDRNSPDQTVYYDLRGVLPTGLSLDPVTGKITGEMPPHSGQQTEVYPFSVAATDTLKESVRGFRIENVKDVPPLFEAGDSNTVVEYFGLEKEYLETTPNPAYDPNGKPVTYSITGGALPPGFSLNTVTGSVYGTLPAAPTEDLVYNFVLTVADKKFNANINVRITSWMNTQPVWETTDLGFGIENKFFERQLVATDRELKEVTFSLAGGSFPAELVLESNGRISGLLPVCPDDDDLIFNFDVEAFDGILSSIQHFTLVVQKNRPPVWVTPSDTLGETLGQKTFSYTLVAVDPNEQVVSYELLSIERSNAQDGVHNDIINFSFNSATGTISGLMPHTYVEDFTYTIRVAALDGDHPHASNPSVVREFTFERKINTAPVWVTEPLLLDTWERAEVDVPLLAIDPQGQEVAYTRKNAGGPIYRNDLLDGILNLVDGRIVGKLPFGLEDREITFWVDADDQTRPSDDLYKTRRTFTIIARFNEPPVFTTPPGLFIKRVENEIIDYHVVAAGVGNADRIKYSITAGNLPAGVTMDDYGHFTGRFPMVAGEEDESYFVTVMADNGTKTVEGVFELVVEKNLAPVWDTDIGEIHYSLANIPMTTSIRATDPNGNRGRPITYSAVGLPTGLSINNATGEISGKLPLAFFETEYPFVGYATDGLETIQRNFMIRGLNNEPMIWQTAEGLFAWPLDDLNPYQTRVLATDAEMEDLTYTFVSGDLPQGLTFHANGVINGFTHSVEADEDYNFVVNVADSYYNEDRSFTLRIVNNLPPEWITPAGQIASLIAGEKLNFMLEASDHYAESVLTFTLQGSLPPGIYLNSETGRLHGEIDELFQPDNTYVFDVVLSDGVFNVARTFELEVLQNRPPLFVTGGGRLGDVHVNSAASWAIVATDDHSRPITYSISSGNEGVPGGLSLDPVTGVISGTANFAEPKVFNFTVKADDGIRQAERGFSIELLNDKPVWVTQSDLGTVNEQSQVNVTVLAVDPEGHPVTYQSISMIDGLTLREDTGVISGTLPVVTEDTTMTLRVQAKDDNVYSDVREFFFDVKFVSPPVWQTPTSLPAGTEQYPYSATLSALSNNQSVTYQVVSGNFPSSLTLNSDGTITGNMPVVEGNTVFTFEVEATAGTKRSSREFTLLVRENLSPVWSTDAILPSVAQKTENYSFTFAATDPNGTPLTYSLVGGAVPTGLTLDFGPSNSYATLSGNIPAAAADATYTFMLGADDGFIRTDRTFSLTVTGNKAPVWTTSTGSIGQPIEGSLFSFTFLADDPEGDAVTYTVVNDTIPLHPQTQQKYLSVDTTARTISGQLPLVMSDQTWTITLRASDPDGAFSDVTYSITVNNDASRYDVFAPYVTSLIHFDGTNGQYSGVKDAADPNRVLTFNSGGTTTSLQTAQKKFGTASLYRNGASGSVNFPITADHNLDSDVTPEWTVEAWVNPAATQTVSEACIFSIGYAGAANQSYNRVVMTIVNGQVLWRNNTGSGAYNLNGGTLTPNVWSHVAVSRDVDGMLRMFVNGVLIQSRANSTTRTLLGPGGVNIGGSLGFNTVDFSGYIDEVRVTKKCRYTGNFPIPTNPFPAPPYFATAANAVVATGAEGTAPTNVTAVVATAQETDVASMGVKYSVVTGGYSINTDLGTLGFVAFPPATEATSDTTVLIQAQDGHGNLSRFWPVTVRSTAQSSDDLKVQWRMAASHNATKSTNPSNPITVSSIDSGLSFMAPAPAPYQNEQAFRTSGRTNYSIQSNLEFMSGDHTFETWVYPTTLTGDNLHIVSIGGSTMRIFRHTAADAFATTPVANKLVLQYGGSTSQVVEGGGDLVAGQWNHVAYTRSGTQVRLFVNGVGGPTVSWGSASFASQTFAFNGFSSQVRGQFTDLYMRAVNIWSTVRYFGNFTPSWPNFGSEPVDAPDIFFSFNRTSGTTNHAPDRGTVTNVSGSALTYVVDGGRNVVNMPVSTGTLKFNTDFSFLSGDFTLETWVKWDAVTREYQTVFDIGGDLSSSYFRVFNNTTNTQFGNLVMNFNSTNIPFPAGLTAGNWVHLAVVKSGNSIRCYTNGVGGTPGVVSSTNVGAFLQNKVATINGYTLTDTWTGAAKMANFGFWKTAKYTGNFTPRPR